MKGDRTDLELAVQVAIDYLGLPAAALTARTDVVHVTVIDADALNRWHYELGGIITSTPTADDVALWTLHTNTPERSDGSTVPIRVHAAIPDGIDVVIDVHRSEVAA